MAVLHPADNAKKSSQLGKNTPSFFQGKKSEIAFAMTLVTKSSKITLTASQP